MPKITDLPLANSVDSDDIIIIEKDGVTSKISFNDFLGGGTLTGPTSSTDNTLPRFNGTTGGVLQGSGVAIDDSDNITTSGSVTASNVSGSNTGDQTITLEGDVTGTGTGTFTVTIPNDTVTFDKIQNLSPNVLLGRTGGSGDVEEISCTSFARTLLDDNNASTARSTLGVVIGTDVQAYSSVLQNTTASFTTADETKLDGIEAGATADQTAEEIQDIAWSVLFEGSQVGINVTYQDSTNTVDFEVRELTPAEFASPNISQWTNDSNYTTNASAIDAVEASNNIFTGTNQFNNTVTADGMTRRTSAGLTFDNNLVLNAGGGTNATLKEKLLIQGSASTSGHLILGEDTDNGTNTVTVIAPASVTANRTQTLPDKDGIFAMTSDFPIKQVVYAETATRSTLTAVIPADNTTPQNTEGTQVLTASITPSSASSKIRIRVAHSSSLSGAGALMTTSLFRDSIVNAITTKSVVLSGNGYFIQTYLEVEDSPSTTSTVTYNVRVGPSSTTMYFNGGSTDYFGGNVKATLILEEIL